MPLILGTNSIKDTGYDVANSCRFDDGSSDYLERTASSAGNRRTLTISYWLKRSNITTSNSQGVLNAGILTDGNNHSFCGFQFNTDTAIIQTTTSNSNVMSLQTTSLFRDVSAWYNFVWKIDTTQGTESNRVKLYVNGVEHSLTGTFPSLNQDSWFNYNDKHQVGTRFANYLNGYLTEMILIDGQALDQTSFGEFDSDSPNIWKPIDVSDLTFGTNGFYLDFENSSSLGADVSGNSNNFTVNNLTSVDQSTDTCTNNFTTLNPLATTTTQGTVSEGNLEFDRAGSSDGWVSILSTIGASSGKYYAEIKIIDVGSPSQGCVLGFLNLDETNIMSSSSTYLGAATADAGMGWYSVGNVFRQGGHVNIINSYTDNDIVMLAMDLDNGYCYFGKNGSWENSGDPTSGSSGTGGYATSNMTANGTYCFAVSCREAGNVQMNFGSPPYSVSSGNADANGYGNFEYAPPSGYYTLNTKNLAEFGG